MAIKARKRGGEQFNALLYRFNKKLKRSGILREAKKRRFFERGENKNARRHAALYREEKQSELRDLKRYGYGPRGRR